MISLVILSNNEEMWQTLPENITLPNSLYEANTTLVRKQDKAHKRLETNIPRELKTQKFWTKF